MADLADAVVVGGGILGASIACELARRAHRVVLLEERRIGSGLTSGGFGWINASSEFTDEKYHRLRAHAVAHYDTIAERGADRVGIAEGGSLHWVDSTDLEAVDRLTHRAATLAQFGCPAVVLNAAEMQLLEPGVRFPSEAVGLFCPSDRCIHPARLLRHLVEQGRRFDLELREDCPATGFTHHGGAISTVETPRGRISTRLLVLAAGPATSSLVAHAAGPEAAQLVSTHAAPGLLVYTPLHESAIGRVLFPPESDGLHLRPGPGAGVLIGADDMDRLIAAQSLANLGSLAEQLHRRASLFVKSLLSSDVRLEPRVCARVMPFDERPIVGAIPSVRGLYVAVTHSGVTLGPLLANLLGQQIATGKPPELLEGYGPRPDPKALAL
jgi:glycine/D-amino acid oxidase-like deaminating enzyme